MGRIKRLMYAYSPTPAAFRWAISKPLRLLAILSHQPLGTTLTSRSLAAGSWPLVSLALRTSSWFASDCTWECMTSHHAPATSAHGTPTSTVTYYADTDMLSDSSGILWTRTG